MSEPILAPNSSWFAPIDTTITRASITEIDIVDSYTPTGNETSWDASAAKDGSVMCYVTGTKLTIAGNGSGCIYVNKDASATFSNYAFVKFYDATGNNEIGSTEYENFEFDGDKYDRFENVTVINGLGLLNTSRATTMAFMFGLMHNLSSFTGVENWDTSNVQSMASMFFRCTSLTSLKDIARWNTGSVIDMDHLFASMEHATTENPPAMSLTEIDVGGWDVSNVLYMGAMFYGCYLLTELDLNNWNTSKVYDINHMFCDCNNLTTLNISKWDISNCQWFNAVFNDCNSLQTIDLSGWNTKNARNINQLFERCTSLIKIIGIEKFNTSMLGAGYTLADGTAFDYPRNALLETFSGCSSLIELDLSSFDTKNVDVTDRMFLDCTNLKTVYVSDLWNMQSVTSSTDMFKGCTRLVGEDGTTYSPTNITKTYARIDGGENAPGYLTHIQNKDDEVLVQSKSLYRIGKSIRKALDSTDKYKPSEMAGAIDGFNNSGGFIPNAIRGAFSPEAKTAVFTIDNLPFKPCGFTIVCGKACTTIVKEGIITTSHINGVGGDLYFYNEEGNRRFSHLDPADPNATNYTDNSLTIDFTGWGMYFKVGHTYDYIISGGFED